LSTPAQAITYGNSDGTLHPSVGTIMTIWPSNGFLIQWCSGTLIGPTVFLTAGHCTRQVTNFMELNPNSRVWVTFASDASEYNQNSTTYTVHRGDLITNPDYNRYFGQYGLSDPGDVGVILLSEVPSGIPIAVLPKLGLLDELKAEHKLKDTLFTVVGYGDQRETNRTAGQAITYSDYTRKYANGDYLSLTDAWLSLSMNFATGNGGVCTGDSGGPHFINYGGNEILVSITAVGDTNCKALDKSYRMDTEAARNFLDEFVKLP